MLLCLGLLHDELLCHPISKLLRKFPVLSSSPRIRSDRSRKLLQLLVSVKPLRKGDGDSNILSFHLNSSMLEFPSTGLNKCQNHILKQFSLRVPEFRT